MKLFPIAMRRPSKKSIYAPSKLRKAYSANVSHSKNSGKTDVSLEEDGVSNPQEMTTYTVKNNPMLGIFIKR